MSCCVGPAQPRQRLQSAAPGRPEGRRLALDFDFDLKRPVKPRWPSAGSEPWATRQDAGLAALGQGWPIAAAHGSMPERGHAEPGRGTEWWGKSVLLTFALLSKVSRRKGGTITRHTRKNGYVHQGLRALRTRAGASSLATGAVKPWDTPGRSGLLHRASAASQARQRLQGYRAYSGLQVCTIAFNCSSRRTASSRNDWQNPSTKLDDGR